MKTVLSCSMCQKPVEIFPSRAKRRKTCSMRCRSLYFSMLRKGRPQQGGIKSRTLEQLKEHLLSHRRITERGCWEWTLGVNNKGYGTTTLDGEHIYVHKLSAFIFKGIPITRKPGTLHSCDNPPCFNPEHLFPGTQSDNLLDAYRKGRRKSRACV